MTDTADRADDPGDQPGPDVTPMGADASRVDAAVKRLRRFLDEHGAPGSATVDYLGRSGARLVMVAADGRFTDVVLVGMDAAQAVLAGLDLTPSEWDRERSAALRVDPADRVRMAGSGR